MAQGMKNRSIARQKVKNYRRFLRNGSRLKSWMRGRPMMRQGPGGTDKGFNRRFGVYYSDKPASR